MKKANYRKMITLVVEGLALGIIIFLVILGFQYRREQSGKNIETDQIGASNSVEETHGDESNSQYMIDRLFNDHLIVRGEDFSEVKYLSQLEECEAQGNGFYESASSKNNTRHSVIYDNYLFYFSDNEKHILTEDGGNMDCLKRVTPTGAVEVIDYILEFNALWDASIIGVHSGDLYVFLETGLIEGANQIIKISNCTQENYSIDLVVSLPTTEYKCMDADSVILIDNGIYFTSINENNRGYIYKVSFDQNRPEPVCKLSEQYMHLVENDEEIIAVDNTGFVVCLCENFAYNAYYFDSKKKELIPVAEGINDFYSVNSGSCYENRDGSEVYGYIEDGYFYHLHTDGYKGTATICRSLANQQGSCKNISAELPYDFSYEGNVLNIYNNYVLYYSFDESPENNSNVNYTLYYFYMGSNTSNGRLKLPRNSLVSISGCEIDNMLFLSINGRVYYTNLGETDIWRAAEFDPDVEGTTMFLHKAKKDVYCVSMKRNSTTNYFEFSSEKIEYVAPSGSTNAEISAQSGLNSDEIFLFVFSPAFEIYNWCRGADNIEEFSTNEVIQVEYKPYLKVVKGEFTKYSDFRAHIRKYFTDVLTDNMLGFGYVVESNDDLYQFMPGYGGLDTTYSVEYYIESYSEDRIVYCQRSKYLIDPYANIPAEQLTEEDLNVVDRYFVRQKIDGKWLFVEWDSSEKP